ncbi:MAG: hypothetical protein RUDDFDWM_000647 [Candidatus Fervidibacterota bacterium]
MKGNPWFHLALLFIAICIVSASQKEANDKPIVQLSVKLPWRVEAIEKLRDLVESTEKLLEKVTVELSLEDGLKEVEGIDVALERLSQFISVARHNGFAIAVSVDLDNIPKLSGVDLPTRSLVVSGKASEEPSLFAPHAVQAYATVFKLLSRRLKGQVNALTLRIPQLDPQPLKGNEIGWHMPYDLWCGDRFAKIAFRDYVRSKYVALSALREAWGVSVERWEDVVYPMQRSDEDWVNLPAGMRRHWLDFVSWYCEAVNSFISELARQARKAFPQVMLTFELPLKATPLTGWQLSTLVREAPIDTNTSFRVDADAPLLCLALLSKACEFYKVKVACNVHLGDKKAKRGSLMLQGNNAIGFQAFAVALLQPEALALTVDEVPRLLRMFEDGELLIPRKHLTDVAVLLPTTSILLSPQTLLEFGERLSTIVDAVPCDLIDEILLLNGACEDYRLLIAPAGSIFCHASLEKMMSWVERGGILLIGSNEVWTDVSGKCEIAKRIGIEHRGDDAQLIQLIKLLSGFKRVADVPLEVMKDVYAGLIKRLGNGFIVWFPIGELKESPKAFTLVASDLAFDISKCASVAGRAISPFHTWQPIAKLSEIDDILFLWHDGVVTLFNASTQMQTITMQTRVGDVKRTLAPYEASFVSVRSSNNP